MNPKLLHAAVMDAPWDEQSSRDASTAAARVDASPESNAADLERMKGQRHAALAINGERVGTVVYEIEDGELFVTALVAARRGIDLLTTFEAKLCELGRAHRCTSIRYGTSRPGMVERTKALGYRVAGVVMRKDL